MILMKIINPNNITPEIIYNLHHNNYNKVNGGIMFLRKFDYYNSPIFYIKEWFESLNKQTLLKMFIYLNNL